jgi:hypothetical protein
MIGRAGEVIGRFLGQVQRGSQSRMSKIISDPPQQEEFCVFADALHVQKNSELRCDVSNARRVCVNGHIGSNCVSEGDAIVGTCENFFDFVSDKRLASLPCLAALIGNRHGWPRLFKDNCATVTARTGAVDRKVSEVGIPYQMPNLHD